MRVFTVHARIGGYDPDRDIVLVKEGFCWPAFFFGPLWALWHRLWQIAAILLVCQLALGAVVETVAGQGPLEAVLGLAFATLVGFVANDARRWTLERRDFTMTSVVVGRDAETALHRFLTSDAAFTASPRP